MSRLKRFQLGSSVPAILISAIAFGSGVQKSRVDPQAPDALKRAERTLVSANGAYQLKATEFEAYKGHEALRWTLSIRSGVAAGHVLWERIDYAPDAATFLSDSGRVLQFSLHSNATTYCSDPKTGEVAKGSTDFAALYVWDTTGSELAGLDLLELYKLGSVAEVRKEIAFDRTEIVSSSPSVRRFQNLALPFDENESYTLRFKDGSFETWRVVQDELTGDWHLFSATASPDIRKSKVASSPTP